MFEDQETGEYSEEFVEVTYGSDSVEKCLIPLDPAESLLVVMNVQLPRTALLQKDGKDRFLLRAFVEEWRLEDSSYVIDQKSKRVKSEAASAP